LKDVYRRSNELLTGTLPDHLIGDRDRANLGTDPRSNSFKVGETQRLPPIQGYSHSCTKTGVALVIGLGNVPQITTTARVESRVERDPHPVRNLAEDMGLNGSARLLRSERAPIEI